jgi:hypothetical protein
MDSIINNLIPILIAGGPAAISAMLAIALIGLVLDRQRLLRDFDRTQKETAKVLISKDEKFDDLINNSFKSSLATADALTSLRVVLAEINVRLTK